jgi:hypothetical protein
MQAHGDTSDARPIAELITQLNEWLTLFQLREPDNGSTARLIEHCRDAFRVTLARQAELEGELRSVDQVLNRRDAFAALGNRVDQVRALMKLASTNDPNGALANAEATLRVVELERHTLEALIPPLHTQIAALKAERRRLLDALAAARELVTIDRGPS